MDTFRVTLWTYVIMRYADDAAVAALADDMFTKIAVFMEGELKGVFCVMSLPCCTSTHSRLTRPKQV